MARAAPRSDTSSIVQDCFIHRELLFLEICAHRSGLLLALSAHLFNRGTSTFLLLALALRQDRALSLILLLLLLTFLSLLHMLSFSVRHVLLVPMLELLLAALVACLLLLLLRAQIAPSLAHPLAHLFTECLPLVLFRLELSTLVLQALDVHETAVRGRRHADSLGLRG